MTFSLFSTKLDLASILYCWIYRNLFAWTSGVPSLERSDLSRPLHPSILGILNQQLVNSSQTSCVVDLDLSGFCEIGALRPHHSCEKTWVSVTLPKSMGLSTYCTVSSIGYYYIANVIVAELQDIKSKATVKYVFRLGTT